VLELGRIRELLPLERASEQMEAVLIDRFGQFEFLTGTLVDSGQTGFFAGRQRERHGNRLALRTREVFEVFFPEALKYALQFAAKRDERVPCPVDGEVVTP